MCANQAYPSVPLVDPGRCCYFSDGAHAEPMLCVATAAATLGGTHPVARSSIIAGHGTDSQRESQLAYTCFVDEFSLAETWQPFLHDVFIRLPDISQRKSRPGQLLQKRPHYGPIARGDERPNVRVGA